MFNSSFCSLLRLVLSIANANILLNKRTSSVGKEDDSESGGPWFEFRDKPSEKILFVLFIGQGALPNVFMDNDHILSLDYVKGSDSHFRVGIHNMHEIKVFKIN